MLFYYHFFSYTMFKCVLFVFYFTQWIPLKIIAVSILIHNFVARVFVLCLIMRLVFGVSESIRVLTPCITELFAPFWEAINLHQFWPFVETWLGNSIHQT